MFGIKKKFEKHSDEAYIIHNIDGVPVYDLKNEKYLMEFSDEQRKVLDKLLYSNLGGARDILSTIAFKGLPAEFMEAFVRQRYVKTVYPDGSKCEGYFLTDPVYKKEINKYIHCNLSLKQFEFLANFYQLFRYINDVPRYQVGELEALKYLYDKYPQVLSGLKDGADRKKVYKMAQEHGFRDPWLSWDSLFWDVKDGTK